ncbi:MAG: thioredoxin family protein [Rubrivivax sp.]
MAMEVKVLGSGCSKCRSTIGIIERAALASGVEVEIVKVEKPEDIHRYGVHATPAVVIGGQVVRAGGLPSALRACGC